MASKLLTLLLLLPVFLISSVSGHNISKILAQFPDFSSFNSLLTQTQLAAEINSRQTITVLVAGSSVVSSISNQPAYVLKRILALHVLLDYYDSTKLSQLTNKTVSVPTLFGTTGHTTGKNGYLNLSDSGGGVIAVGSAEPGARYDAHVIKLVAAQPHNISVLQISNLIIPPNIGSNHTVAPAPAQPGGDAPQPAFPPVLPSAFSPDVADAVDPAASSGNRASVVTGRMVALGGLGTVFWVVLLMV